jgi:hypothetical protein
MSLIPTINLWPTLVIRVGEVSMDTSFRGDSNGTIGGRDRLRWPEILPFSFEVVLADSGLLIRVCEVSMDAPVYGGSNGTIDKD